MVPLVGACWSEWPGYHPVCSLTKHAESPAMVVLECWNCSVPNLGREMFCELNQK